MRLWAREIWEGWRDQERRGQAVESEESPGDARGEDRFLDKA